MKRGEKLTNVAKDRKQCESGRGVGLAQKVEKEGQRRLEEVRGEFGRKFERIGSSRESEKEGREERLPRRRPFLSLALCGGEGLGLSAHTTGGTTNGAAPPQSLCPLPTRGTLKGPLRDRLLALSGAFYSVSMEPPFSGCL